ncbi:MAG: class I SAM-dependent methyltransferase [Acidobacteria bacterium]|nr:class I SAM-dependent methyltransferase [Acidobacteriota bacterium]
MTTLCVPADTALTDRQRRELEYHRDHAAEYQRVLAAPFPYDLLRPNRRRWWNAYWDMYTYLLSLDLRAKRCLVVGCGFGSDALYLAKMGAEVHAFDLCPESLDTASRLARREGLDVSFREMPAERLTYDDSMFDLLLARDILHHVDIPAATAEMRRVCCDGALWVVDEIYSHSITEVVRRSWVVEKLLYRPMQGIIYGNGTPYITADERKMTERDIRILKTAVGRVEREKYFDFLVSRVLPRIAALAIMDRLLLTGLQPIARVLGGRVLLVGRVSKAAA